MLIKTDPFDNPSNPRQFVLICVVVPRQFAFDFCDLHVLIVDTADHLRRPVVTNLVKALLNINFHYTTHYAARSSDLTPLRDERGETKPARQSPRTTPLPKRTL